MLRIIGAFAAIASLLFSAGVARAGNAHEKNSVLAPEVTTAGAVNVSPPIRSFAPGFSPGGENRDKPLRRFSTKGSPGPQPDTALQSSVSGPAVATASGLTFAGVGNGDYGFGVNAAPPDTNGAVGATQYVQWVNESFAVFDKRTGTIAPGFPRAGNTLWSGLTDSNGQPSGCAANNDGDPVVQYDKAANRWIMTQFSVSNPSIYGYLQCVAVSTTSDATGSYYQYAFSEPNFNDYPKLGVWPDGYYLTFNMFDSHNAFVGGRTCALDRTKMLAGDPTAQQVCFQLGSNDGGLLPSDLDGSNPPPAGSPNYVVEFGNNSLDFFKFHVDFTNPATSTLSGPTSIPVASFSAACSGGGTCIPQAGTTQRLDSLADRLMYRLAYRHFADGHESLVVDHSVTAGNSVGVRWYELRNLGGTPSVYQQGTYAPDSNYRWMGSIAMDGAGNIAMGYSVSSSSMFPSIAYTGRVPSDPLGTMQAEHTITTGGGSQSSIQGALSRWGDYSAMTVDPVNDCTFWYTNEYLKRTGTFNWSTRIASFTFPGCGSTITNDFSISANPTSLSLVQNTGGTSTISTAVAAGSTGTVSLAVSGVPSGANASVSPTSVTAGNSSTLTINAGTAAPGNYTVTVTGTEGSVTRSTTVALTVTATPPPVNDFSISAGPTSLVLAPGGNGTSTISTLATSGSGTVALTVSGAPSGGSADVSPTSVSAGGSSTLTVHAGTAAPGSYTVTVTGTEGSKTHSTTVDLTVSAPVSNDFSISANPGDVSVTQGQSGTSTISTAVTSGSAQSVTFSTSSLPTEATASFNPASVNAGGSSTLTLATTTSTPAGIYTITITGTGAGATHTTSVVLTVTAAASGDFSISASPTSLRAPSNGGDTTSTVTITPSGGFSGTVSLSVTRPPFGVNVSLAPTSVTSPESSTLRLTTNRARQGTFTLVVRGNSGSLSHTTSVNVTITRR